MARTASTMLELGTAAPRFNLPEPKTGHDLTIDDFKAARGLVVVFLSNHCPYVHHIREGLAAFTHDYAKRGIAAVGINANDAEQYPEDAPDKMIEEVAQQGYEFPYLFDERQSVAKAYQAACTPDFYLFDGERKLFYRGQFDGARPGNDVPVTGSDLRVACDALLDGLAAPANQIPSMGCNIKWKPGNAPDYYA